MADGGPTQLQVEMSPWPGAQDTLNLMDFWEWHCSHLLSQL